MRITNVHGISLPMAVWLLHDNYDYINDENYISATSLLRPIKQIVLAKHVLSEDKEMDISERVSATFGNAVHDSMERAWSDVEGRSKALRMLGYPQWVIDNLVVNPTEEQIAANPNILPVWIEKRSIKEIDGFKVGGKLDMVIDHALFDFKSTSVYTYLKSRKDTDYQLQGSIYRWLNPELIQKEHIFIQFIFTDWQRFMTYSNPDYPKIKVKELAVELLSISETEAFIRRKLRQIKELWDADESQLPDCTDEELWRSEPEYKYYSNPEKTDGRSTRNFDNLVEANQYMTEKGKGIVKTILGQPKACAYCPAYLACKQREQYDI